MITANTPLKPTASGRVLKLRRSLALAGVLTLFMSLQALGAPAPGDTIYVTDELRLGLYADEQTSGRPTRNLISGDALEVLERSLMSVQVRTEDGDVGWVKTAYVVTTEPGRRRAARLDSELAALKAQLETVSTDSASAEDRISELQAQLTEAEAGILELPTLREQNAELQAELDAVGSRIPGYWAVIVGVVAVLIGFFSGYLWLDRRVRKQFGGIRVY